MAKYILEDKTIFGVKGALKEGVSGIDFGEVTLTSRQQNVEVSHNLGIIPSFVALIPKSLTTALDENTYNTLLKIQNECLIIQPANNLKMWDTTDYNTLKNVLSNTNIKFTGVSDTYRFRATSYRWIAIA